VGNSAPPILGAFVIGAWMIAFMVFWCLGVTWLAWDESRQERDAEADARRRLNARLNQRRDV